MATTVQLFDDTRAQELTTGIAGYIKKKVDSEEGKGLYPDTDKEKLAGIEADADVNKIESITVNGKAATINPDTKEAQIDVEAIILGDGFVKDEELNNYVQKDGDKVLSTNDYTAADKAKVDSAIQQAGMEEYVTQELEEKLADYAQKTDIPAKAFTIKPSVATKGELPQDGNTVGDVRDVQDTGHNFVWTDAEEWDDLGGTFDTSGLATKEEITGMLKEADLSIVTSVRVQEILSTAFAPQE